MVLSGADAKFHAPMPKRPREHVVRSAESSVLFSDKVAVSVNFLRLLMIVTFAEAISWLGLLAGMVAKYGFDNEVGVSIMGRVHGFLFMLFVVVLLITHFQERWPIGKTIVAFLESIPPFLGFWLGWRLLQELRAKENPPVSAANA
jgi:integral membrane protein